MRIPLLLYALLAVEACEQHPLGEELDAGPSATCNVWSSSVSVKLYWPEGNPCRGKLDAAKFTIYMEPFGYVLVSTAGSDVVDQLADVEGEPVCHIHTIDLTQVPETYGFDMDVTDSYVHGTGYYENYTTGCASTFAIYGTAEVIP